GRWGSAAYPARMLYFFRSSGPLTFTVARGLWNPGHAERGGPDPVGDARMPESAAELSDILPAEVMAMGPPEQVFAPGTGKRHPFLSLMTTAGALFVGLVCGAVAANVAGLLLLPKQPPAPQGVALGVGIPCMILGLLSFLGAAWLGLGGALCNQAYLFYQGGLVELFPDRHRVIPWDSIGTPRVLDGLVKGYKFPVREG